MTRLLYTSENFMASDKYNKAESPTEGGLSRNRSLEHKNRIHVGLVLL